MATYVIGDVHGCFEPLTRLLDSFSFNPDSDTLWFAGDLVNRGPDSLKTLRYVKSLEAVTVLGNHDIHLLALYYGARKRKEKDSTLNQVLDAPDAHELMLWLQSQPLVHVENRHILSHAGIHPQWSLQTLTNLNTELQSTLSSMTNQSTLKRLHGNTEGSWQQAEHAASRMQYALNCLTRMRYCTHSAIPEYQCSEPPGKQPTALLPWFEIPNQHLKEYTLLFGHWAALGYHHQHNVYALDTGCAWGNALTALRLEDKQKFSVKATA